MRTIPAFKLSAGQLLVVVDAGVVLKIQTITPVENRVEVELLDQVTQEMETWSFRNDTFWTIEQPLTLRVEGDRGGKITLELAALAGEDGRVRYLYKIEDVDGKLLEQADDLYLPVDVRPDNNKAARLLTSMLVLAADAYGRELNGELPTEPETFSWKSTDWAWLARTDLSDLSDYLTLGGLER